MDVASATFQRLRPLVNRARLVDTALALIGIPSPTGSARAVADRLAAMLVSERFTVERPSAGHDPAPAVVVRLDAGKPGRVLQLDGHLDTVHLPFVAAFQAAHRAATGRMLPLGPKPFVDDGNSFWSLAGIPAITHGPRAEGAHTGREWVDIDDLVRVALLYAATAVAFCAGG